MNKELLKEIGKTILANTIGTGFWHEAKRFEPIKNPLTGLSVGDVVYQFDEDDYKINEFKVVFTKDGVGYVVKETRFHGPHLCPVCTWFSKTITGDEVFADEMKEALEYHKESLSKLQAMVDLVNES